MLDKEISSLINYAVKKNFLPEKDKEKILNSEFNKKHKLIKTIYSNISSNYVDIWLKIKRKINFSSSLDFDIFTDELASYIIGSPNWINRQFYKIKNLDMAMEWYEDLSKFTTYIKTGRIKKNIVIKNDSSKLIVTLNKSKPEKSIKEIINATKNKNKMSALSIKQVGLKGSVSQSPRMAHRVINMPFDKNWFIQYSPYQYFNKHLILVSKKITPMKVDKNALEIMIKFLDTLPKFNISLNADLPIVGGSILNHMHFQAGKYDFPIYNSKKTKISQNVYQLDWPIKTFMIKSNDPEIVIFKAIDIINKWKNFSSALFKDVFNNKHNTVSLTARIYKKKYYLYIILRNSSISKKHPSGIFHVSEKYQIIKQENIGIIEACGLGIFPGRLDYPLLNKINNKKTIKLKDEILIFKNKQEYFRKILQVYELILNECNPFKSKYNNVEKEFIKKIKKGGLTC